MQSKVRGGQKGIADVGAQENYIFSAGSKLKNEMIYFPPTGLQEHTETLVKCPKLHFSRYFAKKL